MPDKPLFDGFENLVLLQKALSAHSLVIKKLISACSFTYFKARLRGVKGTIVVRALRVLSGARKKLAPHIKW